MKIRVAFTLALVLLAFVGACNIGDKESNSLTSAEDEPIINTGAVHTEFLQRLLPRMRKVSSINGGSTDICLAVANEIADKYGIRRFTRQEVEAAIQLGRSLASSKEFTLEGILSGKELEWWDRYSREATPLTAREVYEKHCQLYGPPARGSLLEDAIDVALSSSEFWPAYHSKHGPKPVSAGFWKRVLRFTVAVGVDVTAGAMAGGGIGAGIVGGLASYGADCLLFGCPF